MGAEAKIDTNLQGQRLGRKGRITRDRIIAVARELIEEPTAEILSISAVARRAELRVSSIYNYFPDLSDLLMTVLEPVLQEAQQGYLQVLGEYWADDALDEKCAEFVEAFRLFWERNVRLLHVRNNLAQQHDPRALSQRINAARRVVSRLALQFGCSSDEEWSAEQDMASVLYAGLERVVTIVSDELLKAPYPINIERRFGKNTLKQQARLLALAVREMRAGRAVA